MSKPIRNAVAVVLRRKDQPDTFLTVKRPDEGSDLDGYWGLPATSMYKDELPEDTARRICREKLGCEGVPVRMIGTMFQKRKSYDMFFMDFEVFLTGELQPDVGKARTDKTVYVQQAWAADASKLLPAARGGSCCSTIYLTDQGMLDRDDWVESLEDSSVVA